MAIKQVKVTKMKWHGAIISAQPFWPLFEVYLGDTLRKLQAMLAHCIGVFVCAVFILICYESSSVNCWADGVYFWNGKKIIDFRVCYKDMHKLKKLRRCVRKSCI